MDRGQMIRGLSGLYHKGEGGPDHDKECCSWADITFVQVWLLSQHGDLELVRIRDVIRRKNWDLQEISEQS